MEHGALEIPIRLQPGSGCREFALLLLLARLQRLSQQLSHIGDWPLVNSKFWMSEGALFAATPSRFCVSLPPIQARASAIRQTTVSREKVLPEVAKVLRRRALRHDCLDLLPTMCDWRRSLPWHPQRPFLRSKNG